MLTLSTRIMGVSSNVVAVILCLLVLANFGCMIKRKRGYDNNIFSTFIVLCIIMFVADSLTWILNGNPKYYYLNFFATVLFFTLQPAVCFLWLGYCDYKLYESIEQFRKIIKFSILPVAIVFILSSLSFKYSIFFEIDIQNIYQRGDYYIYYVLFNLTLLLYSVFIVVKKVRKDNTQHKVNDGNLILIAYPLLPILGSIVQVLFYGVNVIWLLSSVSIIIIYFNFQNTELVIDPLTRISNRYKFDYYIDKFFGTASINGDMFLAIIDIDKFKLINDTYGHLEGDYVLKEVAQVIKRSVSQDDFVARLGGDEFAVVGERDKIEQIELTLEDIQRELAVFNQEIKDKKEYKISISIGYSYQSNENRKNRIEMLSEADKNMYSDKNNFNVDEYSKLNYT